MPKQKQNKSFNWQTNISCLDCQYMQESIEYPALMWCDKIKMPMPKNSLKDCVHKIKK